jgi:hypothetical protein
MPGRWGAVGKGFGEELVVRSRLGARWAGERGFDFVVGLGGDGGCEERRGFGGVLAVEVSGGF